DALKKIDENKNISVVNRDNLSATQTPQSFPREKLIEAVKKNLDAKDEAESWLDAGHNLKTVEGQRLNFKITWPEDFTIAKSLIAHNKITRTGLGYDVHQLVPERNLILGGILIKDSPLGLLGHSDADLLTHAIMDSILGAAGLEDIGNIFPASDEKYRNADSIKLLEKILLLVNAKGWRVDFVDAVVEAQVPKLNKYREEIKNKLGKFFDINLKFKSAETLGDCGRGLSMTCWACATLSKEA
ncbi:MAG: 2-C-methyl-D-erythritol 2,4-cyclodiphosphate synthase, partial [Synergistaceae bacterium]|nr:2-C-methyl-D-erythritol 2,4-cyclodiphosphate synthase [Synergistaceae bacterium]